MPKILNLLTIQFLSWVDARPRTYAEAREAWRSTCPTTCAWEDAISDGLIRFECRDGRITGNSRVALSAAGEAALRAALDEIEPVVRPRRRTAGA